MYLTILLFQPEATGWRKLLSRAADSLVFIQHPATAFSRQWCRAHYGARVTFTIPWITGEENSVTPHRRHTTASSRHRISKTQRGGAPNKCYKGKYLWLIRSWADDKSQKPPVNPAGADNLETYLYIKIKQQLELSRDL